MVPSSHTQVPVNFLGLGGFSVGVGNPRGFNVAGFIIKTKDERQKTPGSCWV